jgi:hypothetical protein
MDCKASATREDLEFILLNEDAEPKPLPLSLLVDITSDFSDKNIIGRGGFAIVYKVRNIFSVLPPVFFYLVQLTLFFSTTLTINSSFFI